ncbi:MAG: PcfK-like family protein [Prevotella sp.]|nr:PcfK-like family protein [Prevotella sp.]
MDATRAFKNTIQAYLVEMATYDTNFAERFADPKKNINDCVTYILNQVQESGCNGFEDDEIYGMAVHYYQEEDIEVGKSVDYLHVAVNHVIELTDEEKAEARREAMAQYQRECYNRIANRKKPTVKREQTAQVEPMLFNF